MPEELSYEDEIASNTYVSKLIKNFKEEGILSDDYERKDFERGLTLLDTLQNSIADLLDRLICHSKIEPYNNYKINTNDDYLFNLLLKDIAFKDILFYILENNKQDVESVYITEKIKQINKDLGDPIKGKKTLSRNKKEIIDAFFELNIFTGDRQKGLKDVSYKVGPTTSENFEEDWKMNSLTKVESIKHIVGKLSDINKISNEKRKAALKIFNFTYKTS